MAYFGCVRKSSSPVPPTPPVPPEPEYLYKWDFTKSWTDEIQGKTVTHYGSNYTRDENGAKITGTYTRLYLDAIDMTDKTLEIDIGDFNFKGDSSSDTEIVANNTGQTRDAYGIYSLRYSNGAWVGRSFNGKDVGSADRTKRTYNSNANLNDIDNITIKQIYGINGGVELYFDNVLIGKIEGYFNTSEGNHTAKYLSICGGATTSSDRTLGNVYDITIKGIRIYSNDYINNIEWDLTNSLTDDAWNRTIIISDATQSSNGLTFDSQSDYALIPFALRKNKVYEFDILSMSKNFTNDYHGRFILPDTANGFIWRKQTQQWELYQNAWYQDDSGSSYLSDPTIFSGKTMKMLWNESNKLCIYANDILVYRCPLENALLNTSDTFTIGSSGGQSFTDMVITDIRIYENEEV